MKTQFFNISFINKNLLLLMMGLCIFWLNNISNNLINYNKLLQNTIINNSQIYKEKEQKVIQYQNSIFSLTPINIFDEESINNRINKFAIQYLQPLNFKTLTTLKTLQLNNYTTLHFKEYEATINRHNEKEIKQILRFANNTPNIILTKIKSNNNDTIIFGLKIFDIEPVVSANLYITTQELLEKIRILNYKIQKLQFSNELINIFYTKPQKRTKQSAIITVPEEESIKLTPIIKY